MITRIITNTIIIIVAIIINISATILGIIFIITIKIIANIEILALMYKMYTSNAPLIFDILLIDFLFIKI